MGAADPARPLPAELADGLARFGCPILPMRYESAELTKTAINLYLFGAVTYANTLADLCEEVGADWSEMMPALRLDRRIGPAAYIRPEPRRRRRQPGARPGHAARALRRRTAWTPPTSRPSSSYNARRYRWVHRQLERRVLAARPAPPVDRGLGAGLQEGHALHQELHVAARDSATWAGAPRSAPTIRSSARADDRRAGRRCCRIARRRPGRRGLPPRPHRLGRVRRDPARRLQGHAPARW